jgi:hypothetical protein
MIQNYLTNVKDLPLFQFFSDNAGIFLIIQISNCIVLLITLSTQCFTHIYYCCITLYWILTNTFLLCVCVRARARVRACGQILYQVVIVNHKQTDRM